VATEAIRLNRERLVRMRLGAWVQPARANQAVAPDGRVMERPGQGGVVLGIGLGDPAGGWEADHLEPGVTLAHPDPAANHAFQVLCCVGNRATVLDGPAAGAAGIVYGKHGGVLTSFAPAQLEKIAPGERVAVEAVGVGLEVEDEPDLAVHSCAPELLAKLLSGRDADGRIRVPVVTVLPAEAAAAGIGMAVERFNMDLQDDQPGIVERARSLRFGDLVGIEDHDHRYGRQYRRGWLTVGIIAHGRSIAGGHGFGFTTLLTAPAGRLALVRSDAARLDRLP
jgi:Domain of unknown function (DUF4438), N-terminal/Domain of unknown function (DUF4438), C-terminal